MTKMPTHPVQGTVRAGGMAPARDPQVAVDEEYEAARRRGTVEAFELFLLRHPDSQQAERARQEQEELRKRAPR